MTISPIIRLVKHEYSWEILQTRIDQARVTNQPMVERPWWFANTETGQLYHDICGCIGWPSEVTDQNESLPGYIGIVGIVRPHARTEQYNPINAKFQLLAEAQSSDVPTLLDQCIELRERYGFGVQQELLRAWYGDQERFLTTLALRNEILIKHGGDRAAILIIPPVDFYVPKIFDLYVRSLKFCLLPDKMRFFFGGCDVLKNRLREFTRDDPCVLAIGGLVHSLLNNCTWMAPIRETIFTVDEPDI